MYKLYQKTRVFQKVGKLQCQCAMGGDHEFFKHSTFCIPCPYVNIDYRHYKVHGANQLRFSS